MAKYAKLKSFYASEKWISFRQITIQQRTNEKYETICEYCHHVIKGPKDITIHHKIELTPENVDDVMVSLNPNNVMVVHHDCHNKIHNRFGNNVKPGVYIVYGPPMSGKHTYVNNNIQRGDIVVDIDRLYEAVSMLPSYDKPDTLFQNVIGIYNLLIDNVKTRYGKWRSAYIIGGFADKYKREHIADELGAEIIFCDASIEECLRRLENDEQRQYRITEWQKYINKWFDEYVI